MTARTSARGIWCAWALLAGLGVQLQVQTTEGFPGALIPAIAMGSFVTVGAIVISRQPHNLVGWVCCGAGS